MAIVFSEKALSQTETDLSLKGLTIICDLDYTFLDYDSRTELFNIGEVGAFEERIRRLLKPFRVVRGMDDLLMTLQNKGAEIKFLSARPDAHEKLIRKYLNSLGFKYATLQLAGGDLKSKAEYKISEIVKIAETDPHQKIVLIGDNLDRDLEVFDRAHQHAVLAGKIFATFVRAVRRSIQIPERYFQIDDASGVASVFHKIGLLTYEEARAIHNGKKVKPRISASPYCKDLFSL